MEVLVLTPDQFLRKGLQLVGYSRRRQRRVCRATNLMRFRKHYGSNPIVYAQIWEDMQTTDIPEARIDARRHCPDSFLMAIHFLARYATDEEQSAIFKLCDRTIRDWKWFYAKKVQALKGQKVSADASCSLKHCSI